MSATPAIRSGLSSAARLSLFFFTIFLCLGVYMPFFPVWLAAKGLEADEIAIVLAVPMVVRILTTPFTGAFADRMKEPRSALLLFAVVTVTFVACLGWVDGAVLISIVVGLTAMFWMPLTPISDAFALSVARRDGRDYGRMRLWGSLAFILANLGAGWLVERHTGNVVHAILLFTFSSVAVSAWFLPRSQSRDDDGEAAAIDRRGIMRRPYFLAVIAAAGLVQASHAMIYGFGSIHWRDLGLSGGEIGALWAIGVIAEIVLFAVSGRVVAKLGPLRMIGLAAAAAVLRWTLFPAITDFWVFLVVQALHGLTFGAAHLGIVHHVAQSVPERLAAAGQGLAVTIITAFMAGAMMISGPLYRGSGIDGIHAMTAIAGAALLLSAVLRMIKKRSVSDPRD